MRQSQTYPFALPHRRNIEFSEEFSSYAEGARLPTVVWTPLTSQTDFVIEGKKLKSLNYGVAVILASRSKNFYGQFKPLTGFAGLIFRCTDANNFYRVRYEGPSATITKRVAGAFTNLGTLTTKAGEPFIEFYCIGNKIKVIAGGKELEVTDTAHTEGFAGITASSAGEKWDWLKVRLLP